MATGNLYCAKHAGGAVPKFVGQIRYTLGDGYRVSSSLESFLDTLFERKDFQAIRIDLTQTTSTDSANLGLLAKVGRFARDELGYRNIRIRREVRGK